MGLWNCGNSSRILAQSRRQALTHTLRKASFCGSALFFLLAVAEEDVFHAQRAFFALAEQLTSLKEHGPDVLQTYVRNVRLGLYTKARHAIVPEKR
jgi:hypothetical protein